MDDLLVVSSVVLWIAVAGLSALVFALTRQVGVLYARIAPAGALMVNQQLKVGDPAPQFSLPTLAGETAIIGTGEEQLLFFVAPDCPISRSLLPVLKSVQHAEGAVEIVLASDGGDRAEHEAFVADQQLQAFPYVLSEELGRGYGVSKIPYAVLIAPGAEIAAMGIVNSREHLESLFEAKERNVASIQEYLGQQSEPGVQLYDTR
ncbi:MAG: methylamine dehydrogenase [Gammaproteobacteria bacterium]|nr:methylamine dehydrogenase [Gammaproteobacteria bacterium]